MRTLVIALLTPASAWAGLTSCPAGYAHVDTNADTILDSCVAPSAITTGATLGDGVTIGHGANVTGATILANAFVAPKVTIGAGSSVGGVIGRRTTIGAGVTLPTGSVVGRAVQMGDGVNATGPITIGYAAHIYPHATLLSGVRIGNLVTVEGSASVGGRLARASRVGAGASVTSAVIGPDATLAPMSMVNASAKIRRAAFIGWGATVDTAAVVGRGAAVHRAAFIGAGATVRAQSVVGSDVSVAAASRVTGTTASASPTDGALLQDVVLASGSGVSTYTSPLSFWVTPGTVVLQANAVDADGDAVSYTWATTTAMPVGWAITAGTTSSTLSVNVPVDAPGTVYLTLTSQDPLGNGTTEPLRLSTLDLPASIGLAALGGGVTGYSDGTLPTTCDGYKNAAPAGHDVATTSGVYRIQPTNPGPTADVYCDMTTLGGGWTLVRRRNATDAGWHPVNDNAGGATAYGSYVSDPVASTSFSLAYNTWGYTEYLFRTGDAVKWVQIPRAGVDSGFIAPSTCTSNTTVTASDSSTTPYVVNMCMRNALLEDPWISTFDHAGGDTIDHSMLYGENSYPAWTGYRTNRQGANVWVR